MRIRVLLSDDHKILREGLVSLLSGVEGIEVVGESADGLATVEAARALQPDVIVMDVNMPRLNGIEATRRITAEFPSIRVIGLSMHDDIVMADAFLEAGAEAYLPKGGPVQDLIAAIVGGRSSDPT